MKKYARWIGGGLGWAFGGPVGAILGFALGSMIDNSSGIVTQDGARSTGRRSSYGYTTANDFVVSLLVLTAAVMKADGKVLKSELDYVKNFLERQFGKGKAQDQILLLRDILNQPLDVRAVCLQIKQNMQHPLRLQLLHYIFGLAMADGSLDASEVKVIENIASYLGISQKDYQSIRAMFGHDTESAYKILEIDENADEAMVKKAYRKMAVKYHPDKVSHLGAEFQSAAKEKFQKVQEAYESIKKQRNFK
ncbi:TerB family tellurite resistance protein [Cryomorphaceae bacterium 1068]|nr:TerB family tellurite resistance protein [Cryomorphaceae bacterium 1068]